MVSADYLLTGARVFSEGRIKTADIAVSGGRIVKAPPPAFSPQVFDLSGTLVLPAFADVHVHFREPGFERKETIASGCAAAAAGGYADVCTMPNLDPVPDSPETLRPQLDAIDLSATVRVHPFGAITRGQRGGELADFAGLAPFVAGFSDDGHGVQDAGLMREAMEAARERGRPIVAHCEVNSLVPAGGCVHDGPRAQTLGLVGIPSASEWRMLERDLELVRETRCRYHACHLSTRESVALIRAAKRDGLPVTCETAPHYLALSDADIVDEGRFKMNPPVREEADRKALLEGFIDGTVDCLATDHAPHTAAEKSRGLRGSAFGIVGLETAFPVVYTRLVETGDMALEDLVDRLAVRPRRLFGGTACSFRDGDAADLVAVETGAPFVVDPSGFLSKGRATPFAGWTVSARVVLSMCDGLLTYSAPRQGRR